jgi:hypothetical protein
VSVNPLETFLTELREIRDNGAAAKRTSSYNCSDLASLALAAFAARGSTASSIPIYCTRLETLGGFLP